MKTYIECYPCFLRQAISAARYAGYHEEDLFEIMQQTLEALYRQSPGATPPEIASVVHRIVRDHCGVADPYRKEKHKATRKALELYPELMRLVALQPQEEALETAVRISIAGNIIDLGVSTAYDDLELTLERVLHQPFAINHLPAFLSLLAQAKSILFFGDNAGETVFDRVLVETVQVPVTYVVKGTPVLNDATLEDALMAGLDQCATIVSNGSDIPGTVLEQCTPEVRSLFDQATLVIAKGQGNYETLSEAGNKVFNLLQVKCPVIAGDIGAEVGSIVIRQADKRTGGQADSQQPIVAKRRSRFSGTAKTHIMKKTINIGIIICGRYQTCGGGKCLRSMREHTGGFARYPKDQELQLVGYSYCGGCPGGNIEYVPAEMIRNGAEVIHLATGLIVGYPPCPRIREFKEFIERHYGIPVVLGTHPIPLKYLQAHEKLTMWDRTRMGDLVPEMMAEERGVMEDYN